MIKSKESMIRVATTLTLSLSAACSSPESGAGPSSGGAAQATTGSGVTSTTGTSGTGSTSSTTGAGGGATVTAGGVSSTGMSSTGASTTGASTTGASSTGMSSTGASSTGVPTSGTTTTSTATTATGAGGMGSTGTSSGGGGFTVEAHLASDEGSHLTTVGIVTWSLAGATVSDAHIEFGVDESYGMEAPVDLTEEGYRTLLLGMKGDTTYHFRIVANGGAAMSDDFTIATGTVPGNVASFNFSAQAGSEPGFITMGSWQGSKTAFIIDSDGDIVWWYDSPAQNIGRARMSADGKNMWMVAATNMGNPLYRISMDGLDKQTYNGLMADHDLTPVSGETIAYLDFGGTCDRIFEITPAGNATMIFDSTSYVSQSVGFLGCHGNSIRYSAAEDVYIFSEWQQDVLVVNRDGSLAWRLTDEVGANSTWGGEQHATHLLDDTLLIFANKGGGAQSAVIEYSRTDWSVVNTFNTGLSTDNMGDVQRLPGGNTLITYSNAGEIREVDGGGNAVLSITRNGGPNFGYTMWRPSLYGPPPDIGM